MSHRVIALVVGGLGLSALLSCTTDASTSAATAADTAADASSALPDDDGTSASDTSAPGDDDAASAPDGSAPEDADNPDAAAPKLCINPEDLNAIQSKSPRSTLKDCLLRCYTASDSDACTADCMHTTSNLTAPCTDCFTNMLDCLLAHCYEECDPQAANTAKCGDCGRTNGCVDRFSGCAGLTPPK